MSRTARALEWLLARAIPAADREAALGDLTEEEIHHGLRRSLALMGIAFHHHAEPYRDQSARLCVLALLVAGLTVLWAVPTAAGGSVPDPDLYPGPIVSLLLVFWSASHITAAAASGLLVGHAPWLPSWAAHARWHVAGLLCVFSLQAAATVTGGIGAAALLSATAWFGDRARVAEPRSPARKNPT